jgi:hypothetical protein
MLLAKLLTVLTVLLTVLGVLAVPLEQTKLAGTATPSPCAQEFPYAVPRPATQPRKGETSHQALQATNRFQQELQAVNTRKLLLAAHDPGELLIRQSVQRSPQANRSPRTTTLPAVGQFPDNGSHAQRLMARNN